MRKHWKKKCIATITITKTTTKTSEQIPDKINSIFIISHFVFVRKLYLKWSHDIQKKKTIYYLKSAKTKEYTHNIYYTTIKKNPKETETKKNCLVEQQKTFYLCSACLPDCLRVPGNFCYLY